MTETSPAKLKAFSLKNFWTILKKTFTAWNEDEPFRLSAVVAYYALFSLPALLVIIVNAAGAIWGEAAIQGKISSEIGAMLGGDAARQVEQMVAKAGSHESSLVATIISLGVLFFGATGAFYQLQQSLNIVWKVKQKPKIGILRMLFDRVTAFGLILVIAFLMLISLALTAALSIFRDWIMQHLPAFLIYVFYVVNFLVSLGIVMVLFALIFKVLPDVRVPWKAVWMGALITAVLFVAAKFALGIYFGEAQPGSTYGAAGSVVLILLWVSYSCLILFFGAEFTKVYAHHHQIYPKPSPYAIKYKEETQVAGCNVGG